MASNRITARRSFHRIWIAGKKSLVKRAPANKHTLTPYKMGRFAHYIFKRIFINGKYGTLIKFSMKFVFCDPIDAA